MVSGERGRGEGVIEKVQVARKSVGREGEKKESE